MTDPLDGLSRNETIKARSQHLRGTIKQELGEDTPAFTEDAGQVLKFHGVYQQDDRDRRKQARAEGLGKAHMMMVRTRIPGGVVSPDGYLAHDDIAGRWGNGTLRVTTRQDFQLHGVLKADLHATIRAINDALMTTLGGCGDQERNIMCCPAPLQDDFRRAVRAELARMVPALTPSTRAYAEIWIDGEVAASIAPPGETEALYGEQYLPRKFKTAVVLEGDNCVDAYSNDLALVAMRRADGGVAGWNVLVGGGLGRTHNKPETYPAVAVPLASLLVCNFADVATTGRLLSMGGREMNPVAGWLIANHWLLVGKLAVVAVVAGLVMKAPPKRWIVPALWVAAAVYALIIAFHLAELGLA